MGYAPPVPSASRLAAPHRQVISYNGDGVELNIQECQTSW